MENMTSKELKAMAKELGVKNWWNLKKAELIAAIEAAQFKENVAQQMEDEENDEEYLNGVNDIINNTSSAVSSESAEEVTTNEDIVENEEVAQNEAPKTSKRKQDLIEYNGKVQNLSAWARELGMPGQTLYARLRISNWPVEKAFTTPMRKKKA